MMLVTVFKVSWAFVLTGGFQVHSFIRSNILWSGKPCNLQYIKLQCLVASQGGGWHVNILHTFHAGDLSSHPTNQAWAAMV